MSILDLEHVWWRVHGEVCWNSSHSRAKRMFCVSGALIYERSRVSVAVKSQWDSFFLPFFLLMNEKSQTAVQPRDNFRSFPVGSRGHGEHKAAPVCSAGRVWVRSFSFFIKYNKETRKKPWKQRGVNILQSSPFFPNRQTDYPAL